MAISDQDEHDEPQRAALVDALELTVARAHGRLAAQPLAPRAVGLRLLEEGLLELGEALPHPHNARFTLPRGARRVTLRAWRGARRRAVASRAMAPKVVVLLAFCSPSPALPGARGAQPTATRSPAAASPPPTRPARASPSRSA